MKTVCEVLLPQWPKGWDTTPRPGLSPGTAEPVRIGCLGLMGLNPALGGRLRRIPTVRQLARPVRRDGPECFALCREV
ncbi:hypothetical protein Nans01_44680 [Nocardiopsis ansamitocini]|uniref:Uncharacterized protein n=1 Tax=Nocardiopsis ansamitocini TaxID=1670832 RepID=A0A9W6UKV5_9ACTN|nr:hypothetical protein Nans01_44680 [Nocardiopsis ansamitocini]